MAIVVTESILRSARAISSPRSTPPAALESLRAGREAMARATEVVATNGRRSPLDAVRLLASVPNPPKYLAIGMNYRKNIEQAERHNIKAPDTPV